MRGGIRPRRSVVGLRGPLVLLLLITFAGCRTSDPSGFSDGRAPFSGRRALSAAQELVTLSSVSPGATGKGQAQAFGWIEDQLRDIGAELGPIDRGDFSAERSPPGRPLLGVLPGRSPDVFLLAATCCAESGTASFEQPVSLDSVSGAAVVLELGRALQKKDKPFTVWLAFIPESPDLGQATKDLKGVSAALAREPLRLAVFFESLAWPTLEVIRDLRSQGVYREAFWESARSLDLGAVFVQSAPFASPPGLHRLLLNEDFRPVVGLVGQPGSPPKNEPPLAQRLDEFGQVVLDALDRIAARLQSIDEFRGTLPGNERPTERSDRLD
ncbi:hypothetical protein MK280_00895 [Myxococcota bacterium]|nr:hypothetical protein [Myxococcota bacterium]